VFHVSVSERLERLLHNLQIATQLRISGQSLFDLQLLGVVEGAECVTD
jgi:hypothetical protein